MICEWGYNDCKNIGEKCHLCFSDGQYYDQAKQRKPAYINKRAQKADKRMGASFEYENHKANEAVLTEAKSMMTPNSGAGAIKGDERIRGLVNIMEELKTKVTKQTTGKESFTIKREWLTKLHAEANAANEEFWYLKFSFNEYAQDVYVVVEADVMMSMVATIVEDRRKANLAQSKIDVADKRRQLVEAQNIALIAEIELLKAQLKLKEQEEEQ